MRMEKSYLLTVGDNSLVDSPIFVPRLGLPKPKPKWKATGKAKGRPKKQAAEAAKAKAKASAMPKAGFAKPKSRAGRPSKSR